MIKCRPIQTDQRELCRAGIDSHVSRKKISFQLVVAVSVIAYLLHNTACSKDAVPCERFVNEVGTHLSTHPDGFEVFEVDGVRVHGNLCFKRFRSACTLVENLIMKTADSEAEEIERIIGVAPDGREKTLQVTTKIGFGGRYFSLRWENVRWQVVKISSWYIED